MKLYQTVVTLFSIVLERLDEQDDLIIVAGIILQAMKDIIRMVVVLLTSVGITEILEPKILMPGTKDANA